MVGADEGGRFNNVGLPEFVPELEKLILCAPFLLTLASPAPDPRLPSSPEPSSDIMLQSVLIEFAEILRLRLRDRVRSRSSDKRPWGVNWDCSDGFASAEANASRTGNGVRLRTWMAVICRTRR